MELLYLLYELDDDPQGVEYCVCGCRIVRNYAVVLDTNLPDYLLIIESTKG